MKIIGLVPRGVAFDENSNCMEDFYKLGNNYVKRVAEAGCLPIGLAPVDNRLPEEALAMCDGFLVQGGAEFYPYHFQVIHHAITHKKKYLGICLGQQLIYVFFEIRRRVEEEGYEGDIVKAIYDYIKRQGKGFSVQKRIPDHRKPIPERGREEEAKHDVNIIPGSLLHRVMGRDTMRICSFHSLCTPPEQALVPVNAWSALGDNVVEGTEYEDFILGVQGHPEADDLLMELFEFLK